MNTLQFYLDEAARKHGHPDGFYKSVIINVQPIIEEAATLYAEEACKEQPWISIKDIYKWPAESETVWFKNEDGTNVMLGCFSYNEDGWFICKSNGTIYAENGKIVSECEHDDDYEFTHFAKLPFLTKHAPLAVNTEKV